MCNRKKRGVTLAWQRGGRRVRRGRGGTTSGERDRGLERGMYRGGTTLEYRVGRDDARMQGVGTSVEYRERSKLTSIEPRDHYPRSHWSLPSDRYAYVHARTTTINTPALEQISFSNAIWQTRRSDYGRIYKN